MKINTLLLALLPITFTACTSFRAHNGAMASLSDRQETVAYGAAAMASNMECLPYLTPEIMAFSESSYDRRGMDVDLPAPSLGNPYPTYLGIDEHGDRILLDVKGPGCVYRLFMSEMQDRKNARLKIYFDGNATPTIDEKVSDLCQAHVAGFPCPLVHIRNQAGTGAPFTSQNNDVPLPFATSIKITCTDKGQGLYQNIQYHLFAPGTKVQTWSPTQDLTKVLDSINRPGQDPKTTLGNLVISGDKDLPAGGSVTLADLHGQRQIQSIKIRLPGYVATAGESLTASGVAFSGQSQFNVTIEPTNDGVRLQRVYVISPNMSLKAHVLVDGHDAGLWQIPAPSGNSPHDQLWRESSFYIPRVLTNGKKSIALKIVNADSDKVWNEYRYAVFSCYTNAAYYDKNREVSDKATKAKGYRLTDELNIGDAKSVAEHAYMCQGKTWSRETTSRFLARSSDYLSLLKNIRLKISWDDETFPSVNARLCEFFAQSEFGLDVPLHAQVGRSLAIGLDEDNQLYCFFPMPFQSHAKIELVSARDKTTPNIQYEIQYKKFDDDFSKVGYFKTNSIHAKKTPNDTTPFTLLDVAGSGKLVGVTDNMVGPPVDQSDYLEGDEQIYVDGSNTAAICGSGKEDFHGGSYYFYGGPASLPFSGCTYNEKWGYNSHHGPGSNPYRCSAYRLMINDFVPFRTHLKFDMEHGSSVDKLPNHSLEESTYLTFYYFKPTPAMVRTDTLEPADADSCYKHHYDTNGKTCVTKTGNWDRSGYYGPDKATHIGMALAANAQSMFTATIAPNNRGVMLRRLMWYADANQQAQVLVDGQIVGIWYDAGSNTQKETESKPMLWRQTQFFIPDRFTHGKHEIQVQLQVNSPVWNEYQYEVFSMNPRQ